MSFANAGGVETLAHPARMIPIVAFAHEDLYIIPPSLKSGMVTIVFQGQTAGGAVAGNIMMVDLGVYLDGQVVADLWNTYRVGVVLSADNGLFTGTLNAYIPGPNCTLNFSVVPSALGTINTPSYSYTLVKYT